MISNSSIIFSDSSSVTAEIVGRVQNSNERTDNEDSNQQSKLPHNETLSNKDSQADHPTRQPVEDLSSANQSQAKSQVGSIMSGAIA